MEQRRLRLGDILDDYCPRERRLTNHAVVAMIEEDVKQTRCTTCDAEHAYKGGKVPRRRKKETTAALYKEVLAGHLAADGAVADPDPEDDSTTAPEAAPAVSTRPVVAPEAAARVVDEEPPARADEFIEDDRPVLAEELTPDDTDSADGNRPVEIEEGPVHRPLIRAQLPRIEGQKEERRLPEFTIRQRSGGGHFRGGDARMKPHRPGGAGSNGQSSGGNGNRGHGGPRFAGPRPAGQGGRGQSGRGGGPAAGFRSGRKRSR
jgi:translation initiation factor IF-2